MWSVYHAPYGDALLARLADGERHVDDKGPPVRIPDGPGPLPLQV